MTHHPLRDAVIHTFERRDSNEGGPRWLARFHPDRLCIVFFTGDTEAEAIEKAEALRTEAIEKHEAAYIARMEAAAVARAKAKAKKEAAA
ncbi:hypothetical protein ACGYLO_16420 [Sulfitobacter sp. 1A13353]|uniref:hypothetical protein n=1 Tax=Sulfitobacter sp. 1A13353 TaxID=3368568 RepID=UPI0037454947